MGMDAGRVRVGAKKWALAVCAAFAFSGCEAFNTEVLGPWDPNRPRVKLPEPQPERVLRDGQEEEVPAPKLGTLAGDFAAARILYEEGKFGDAARVFSWLGDRAKRAKDTETYEDCLFWYARSLEMDRQLPAARRAYHKLMNTFPYSPYQAEAVAAQVRIGENWLEDTREEMQRVREGKSSMLDVLPVVHLDREKPLLSAEANGLSALQAAYLQYPQGPHADVCLHRVAGVNFFRERWLEADRYYTLLVETNPRSPLAPHAMNMAIQSKINSIGGIEYDTSKLAEARQMCDTALRQYPELNAPNQDGVRPLTATLLRVNELQAEKDYSVAEYYRRTGKKGSAYFYYEIVTRRYSGTVWAEKAQQRLLELRDEIEAQNADKP